MAPSCAHSTSTSGSSPRTPSASASGHWGPLGHLKQSGSTDEPVPGQEQGATSPCSHPVAGPPAGPCPHSEGCVWGGAASPSPHVGKASFQPSRSREVAWQGWHQDAPSCPPQGAAHLLQGGSDMGGDKGSSARLAGRLEGAQALPQLPEAAPLICGKLLSLCSFCCCGQRG